MSNRIICKPKRSKIIIKSEPTQELNHREAQLINSGAVIGFLPFDIEPRSNGLTLTYSTEGLLPLSQFLKMSVLSRRMFGKILKNIINGIRSAEVNVFSKQLLVLDTDYIMIDPSSWRILLMYVPLQPFEAVGNLQQALIGTVASATFDNSEDLGYVSEYMSIIQSGVSFSAFMLDEYIKKLNTDDSPAASRCAVCGSMLNPSETVCPACGTSQPGKIVPPVHAAAAEAQKKLTLYNMVRGNVAPVTKNPFRIGKLAGICDLGIPNPAVSRNHADIINEHGEYYVMDLGSTNGTFLNGRRLANGVRQKLTSGDSLVFANEQYRVIIE